MSTQQNDLVLLLVFQLGLQSEVKVSFLIKCPSLRSIPHLSFQLTSPSFLLLFAVSHYEYSNPSQARPQLCWSRPSPGSSVASSMSGDTEWMLHCRVLIGAMGGGELLTLFLYLYHVFHWSPPNALCQEPRMLIRCFSLCGDPPLPTCPHWHPPCCGCCFQLALFTIPAWDSPRPCVVRESKEGRKGHQSRMAEFTLPLFLYESMYKKRDNREESLGWFWVFN